MSEQKSRLERLLDDLAEAQAIARQLETATHVSEQLPAYAEWQLRGGDPTTQFPEVAAHLAICPDCADEYDDLLLMLQPGDDDAIAAPAFDFSRLPLPPAPTNTLTLEEGDVILPPQTQRDPRSIAATAWLQADPGLLPKLRQQYQIWRSGATRSKSGSAAQAQTWNVPRLSSDASIDLSIRSAGTQLSGKLQAGGVQRGQLLRLYRLENEPEMLLTFTQEQPLKALGRFQFDQLVRGDYVLSLIGSDESEIPLALVPQSLWEDSSL